MSSFPKTLYPIITGGINLHVYVCIAVYILERCWNMWIPGFGSDELRPFKKQATTEAHKQVSGKVSGQIVTCSLPARSYYVVHQVSQH